jgi:hypothetical protein
MPLFPPPFSGSTSPNVQGYATTVTSGGTTVLTATSKVQQYFTGTSSQTVTLPDPTTLVLGQYFEFVNTTLYNSVVIQDFQSNVYLTLTPSLAITRLVVVNVSNSTGSWDIRFAQVPTVSVFTSGSGTYGVPQNASYLIVECLGGGGGGAGSATVVASNGGSGQNGQTTTFGGILFATGGNGNGQNGSYAFGGGTSVGGSAQALVQVTGGQGGGAGSLSSGAGTTVGSGGMGGSSYFGGAGGNMGGTNASTGGAANANSGSGGGGAGSAVTPTCYFGGGGGAGGYVKAILKNLPVSYTYSVAAGGGPGAAGTSGYAGGAGGAGIIIVTAYFE